MFTNNDLAANNNAPKPISSDVNTTVLLQLTLGNNVQRLLSPREGLSDLHDHRRHHGEGDDGPRDVGAEARARAALAQEIIQ